MDDSGPVPQTGEDRPEGGVTRVSPLPGARLMAALGSSKLALILVALLGLFTLVGSVVPQRGIMDELSVTTWQEKYASIDGVVEALGWYEVFSSWAFLATVALFAVNTAVCTVLRYVREGGMEGVRRGGWARRGGFYVLHVALVVLIAGGFWTFATQMKAYVILTEGQVVRETHSSYPGISKGPLRPEGHTEVELRLDEVDVVLEDEVHRVGVTSHLTLIENDGTESEVECAFNRPLVHRGVSFVQDEIGFAPRLEIRELRSRRPMVSSFVALKTTLTPDGRVHRDFLPLPFLDHPIVVRFLPDADDEGAPADPYGDRLGRTMLAIETLDESGESIPVTRVRSEEWGTIGAFQLRYTEVRRWSGLRVREDRGYPVVWGALWLALAAMVLRYSPDLAEWMRESDVGPDGEGESHGD